MIMSNISIEKHADTELWTVSVILTMTFRHIELSW
jgi:hypothetical protein